MRRGKHSADQGRSCKAAEHYRREADAVGQRKSRDFLTSATGVLELLCVCCLRFAALRWMCSSFRGQGCRQDCEIYHGAYRLESPCRAISSINQPFRQPCGGSFEEQGARCALALTTPSQRPAELRLGFGGSCDRHKNWPGSGRGLERFTRAKLWFCCRACPRPHRFLSIAISC
jgi:hypothetical protein